MRRARALAAVASVAAGALAAPAAAWVRTSDPDTGVEVSWALPVVPWFLSSAPSSPSPGCAAGADGDPLVGAVRASFAQWEQGCANLKLVYGGRIGEIRTGLGGVQESLVVVRKGWCSVDPVARLDPCMTDPDVDCGGIFNCFEDHGPADRSTVALTTVLYDPVTGRIFDADMEVNGWDGSGAGASLSSPGGTPPHGYYFTCDRQPGWPECTVYDQADCYAFDLQNTVTHEAGHVIGLAHPCGDPGTPSCSLAPPPWETVAYAGRTMFPSTAPGDVEKRSLSADDVGGVCAVYPAESGCGSAGGPGALATLLAVLALRPRVRRRGSPRTPPPAACRR